MHQDHKKNSIFSRPVELTKLAIPHLLETKGNIINVSSGLATIAIPNAIAYAISKALVEQFTKCVAIDPTIAGKIRVNCISRKHSHSIVILIVWFI